MFTIEITYRKFRKEPESNCIAFREDVPGERAADAFLDVIYKRLKALAGGTVLDIPKHVAFDENIQGETYCHVRTRGGDDVEIVLSSAAPDGRAVQDVPADVPHRRCPPLGDISRPDAEYTENSFSAWIDQWLPVA